MASTATAVPASPTPCPVQPVRAFGTLTRAQPAVATRLGCALAPDRGIELVAQSFQSGRLFWRGDRREIAALLDDGRWRSYTDTFTETETVTPAAGEPVRGFGKLWREQADLRSALGAPIAAEAGIGATVEEFARGQIIRTADRAIYALYADGSWERYAETSVEPIPAPTAIGTPAASPSIASSPAITATRTSTATQVAVATPPGTPSPIPTRSATGGPVPTSETGLATVVVPACQVQPVAALGLVYRTRPNVPTRLGCASAPETSMQMATQAFQRGTLVWLSDTREIVLPRQNGTWPAYLDTWQEGEAPADVGTPLAGRIAPERGFGKLWRQQPGLRQELGWAVSQERGLPGAVQELANGRMIWTSDRFVYVLYVDGTWEGFPDS